jgi:hypothetical protein
MLCKRCVIKGVLDANARSVCRLEFSSLWPLSLALSKPQVPWGFVLVLEYVPSNHSRQDCYGSLLEGVCCWSLCCMESSLMRCCHDGFVGGKIHSTWRYKLTGRMIILNLTGVVSLDDVARYLSSLTTIEPCAMSNSSPAMLVSWSLPLLKVFTVPMIVSALFVHGERNFFVGQQAC